MRDGVLRKQSGDEAYGDIGKCHSEYAADDRQDDGLGEQLLHDAEAGGTEGEAGCQLLQAGGSRARRQHKDGDIAAADEKQQGNGDEEHNQGALELAE